MSISPLVFTGVSKFSEDFQTIIDRATRIASLPATALQNQQKDLVQQKILVSNLSASVSSLSTAVANLGDLASKKALTAVSGDTSKVTATSVSASSPARYTISNITSIAKQAAETSVAGYANSTSSAVSSTGTVKLTVGSQEFTIDISSSNNLTTLRNSINALDAGVTASILTTGTGATPYYLSITADAPGATTLTLKDDPTGANTGLLTSANQGANTVFSINGVPVSKTSTLINDVVPGVTFNILDTTTGAEEIAVTLASNRSSLASAIDSFVSAYNATQEQLNAQVGESAGLLSGDFLVREVRSKLQGLSGYEGSGGVSSLAELGIEFDTNGVATFDETTFNNLDASELDDAFEFFGSTTTGFGALSRNLSQVSDPYTGLAKLQIDQYDLANKRISTQLTEISTRVNDMQKSMASRLQIMDTLLASLTSQQNLISASIDSLAFTTYGRQSS